MKKPKLLLPIMLGLSAASCVSSGPIGEDPSIQLVELTELPAAPASQFSVVRAQDELEIKVLGFEDLDRRVRVSGEGTFEYPLIGTVDANGRSTRDIGLEIADRLRGDFVVDPQVSVEATEQSELLFTVGGDVGKPGRYPAAGELSLLEAVAVGGGTTDTSDLTQVVILRQVGDQRYIGLYDLKAIARGNYGDPTIYPGDIIQVGNSSFLRQVRAIATITPLITAPVILIDRLTR